MKLHSLPVAQLRRACLRRQGFSLVEILVGFALIAVLLGTANVLLFSALRSARKASAAGIAKAEGAYALNAMAGTIKYARSIEACGANSVTLRRVKGHRVTYSLAGTGIASASADLPVPGLINLTSSRVVISTTGCAGGMFPACVPGSTGLTICFAADVAGISQAGESGAVNFQTQVGLRNAGN